MWRSTQLADLFDVGSAKRVLKSQWQTEGVPFYRGREITKLSSQGYVDNELFITEELYAEYKSKYGVPSPGDIVITAIGTIGNSYIVQEDDRFYFKDASVLCLRKVADVDSQFINYWLKSTQMKLQLDEGKGATVDTLTITKMKSLNIDLPPLQEQQRIVAILDDAFAGIDLAITNTERNIQNARDLFENKLTVLLTSASNNWVSITIGEVASKVEYGSSAKSKPEGKIPVIRMGNIQDGEIDWADLKYTSDEEEIERYSLCENDVLFNRTNSAELVGKTALYRGERPAIFAGYLIRVHWKEDRIDPEFLNFYLNSSAARKYGEKVMSKSINQANINGTKLKTYPICLPPMAEQKEIVQTLIFLKNRTSRLVQVYEQKLVALRELKQSLLQKAFAGELTSELREVA